MLVQLVPWPAELFARLSPYGEAAAAELDARYALGFATSHSLSIDPPATLRAAGLFAAFAVMAVGMGQTCSGRHARRLVVAIAWTGVALALLAIIQKPLYEGAIYGLWTPVARTTPFGPFVNRNHFAGWMLMAIPLVLGYIGAIVSRSREEAPTVRGRIVWLGSRDGIHAVHMALAVALMGCSVLLSLSRSGMLALIAALIVGTAAAAGGLRAGGRGAAIGIPACLAVLVVLWAGTDAVAARFASPDTIELGGRLPIWEGAVLMARDFWLTGSGVNTFGSLTLLYPTMIPGWHVGAAHNDYLQLAVEGGLLVGVPALVALAAFVVAVRRRLRQDGGGGYWIRLGAVIGLLAAAFQTLVEFSLQIPANAALFALLCAIALHPNPRAASTRPCRDPVGE
jgi:O-antigen ligase